MNVTPIYRQEKEARAHSQPGSKMALSIDLGHTWVLEPGCVALGESPPPVPYAPTPHPQLSTRPTRTPAPQAHGRGVRSQLP